MNKLRTIIATVALAFTALVLAPGAASAYEPAGPGAGTVTIAPGGSATINFTGFAPDEQVTFTLTGENAAGATLASLATVVNSKTATKPANAAGAVSVTVTLPSNAVGQYTLTAVGQASGATASTTIQAANAGSSGSNNSGVLPSTGSESSTTMALIIGGVLLAGGLTIAMVARRQRHA